MVKFVFLVLLACCVSGCNIVVISHKEGELPKIDVVYGKDFCTQELELQVRKDEIGINCSIKTK